MKTTIAIALAMLVLISSAVMPALAVSQAGGISLTFPVGSRFNALGEAGTAASTDYTAMWWNPGGFAYAADSGNDMGMHMMYTQLVPDLADDVYLLYAGLGGHISGWGMLGINLTYLDQGTQQATTETGDDKGQFNSKQYAIGATFGTKLTDQLGFGLGVKYFRDELAPGDVTQDQVAGEGDSWAFDFGAHYRIMDELAGGITFANIGPNITFVDEAQADPMPRTLRMGLAYEAWNTPAQQVNVIADYLISMVKDDKTKVLGLGAEWGYAGYLFLRVGYKDDPEGDIQAITAGGGVDMGSFIDQNLTFDYANVPQADGLDRVHRFSLGWEF